MNFDGNAFCVAVCAIMDNFDYEYDFGGAPVVYSDLPPPPKNPLNRPDINYKKFIISIVAFIVVVVASLFLAKNFLSKFIVELLGLTSAQSDLLVVAFFSIVYISIVLKRGLIWLVHVYQHYAPDEVRLKCVFEPSCSEYMILSIKKHGAIFGVIKGISRLLRCHPPNGGCDLP